SDLPGGVRGAGGSLPGQPAWPARQQEPDGAREGDQPIEVADPGPGRACVPDREAALGVLEDTLPGDREEPGPGLHDVRVGQPVRAATPTPATWSDVRPVIDPASQEPVQATATTQWVEAKPQSTLCAALIERLRAACAEVP